MWVPISEKYFIKTLSNNYFYKKVKKHVTKTLHGKEKLTNQEASSNTNANT